MLRDHRIVILKSLRKRVVELAHGIVKTKRLIRSRVWFSGIDEMTLQGDVPLNHRSKHKPPLNRFKPQFLNSEHSDKSSARPHVWPTTPAPKSEWKQTTTCACASHHSRKQSPSEAQQASQEYVGLGRFKIMYLHTLFKI